MSKSKGEVKDLKEKLADMDKKGDGIYARLTEATAKITRLEKEAEAQEEVLKKRHEEINSLLKENNKYKAELDNIRKQFGNMGDIETRMKVAELKEEKINGLLNQLDQIMTSTENNLTCYSCMNMLSDPHILTPCGHAFCKKCVASAE